MEFFLIPKICKFLLEYFDCLIVFSERAWLP